MDTIDRIRDAFQHPLQVEGILLNGMYDDRTNLTRQVAADLREFFADEVFQHDSSPQRSLGLRHPVSASRLSLTTPAPRAPKATSGWPKRSWTMNKTEKPRKALGRGLGALQRDPRRASNAGPPLLCSRPGSV